MHRPTRHGARERAAGFSLIELMVTVAVLAILGALAMPSFESMINTNRLANASNEMLALLQAARTEAVTRTRPVYLLDSYSQGNGGVWRQDGFNAYINTKPYSDFAQVRVRNPVLFQSHAGDYGGFFYGADGRMRVGSLTNSYYLAYESVSAIHVRLCIPTNRPRNNIRDLTIRTNGRADVVASSGNGECPQLPRPSLPTQSSRRD